MAKVGRPSKFSAELCEQATKLAKLGATDKDIAEFFCVTESTIYLWQKEHPEFSEALKAGKEIADALVASKLFHRATGYEHPDVHISNYQGEIIKTEITKHYPPDTTACIFWLKNRQREKWRDKQDHEHTGKDGGPIQTQDLNDIEAARRIAFLLAAGEQRTH
jgi:hypothetical protein